MGSRETVVFCLDISPGLGGEDLESTLDVARLAVRRKITAYPKDEVGLVLAGTAKSANPLYDDMGEQYAHINVVQDVLPVAAAGIKTLRFLGSPIPPEDRASDVDLYSALVTAVYVIINRIGKRRKAPGDTHRIMLTTAGTEPLSMPDEDALDQVASQCKDFNINIVVLTIGIDVDAGTCSPDSASKRSTLEMLAALGGKMGDRLRCTALAAALAELSMHRPPAPKPSRSKFKGALELPDLKIRVVVYPKVVETRLPPPKSFSLIARERFPYPAPALPAADEAGAGSAGGSLDELPAHDTSAIVALGRNPWEVEKDRSYTAVSDRTRNVGPDKTIKAHKYGPDFVVEQQTEAGSFKWSTGDKCLKVVEFVRQDGLLPKDRMGGCDVLMADESDPHAGAAIGALVTALMDTETAMVVRFIPRKNAAPRASACWPHAEEVDGSIAYSLLLDNRPFAEEVRTAAWPPAEAASAPTAGQLAAASELIDAMMLNTGVGGSDEAAGAHIDLDELRNPYMEHMNRLIVERALTAGAEIPELDPAIAATLSAPREVAERARAQLDAFAAKLPTSAAASAEGGFKRTRHLTMLDEGGEGEGEQSGTKRALIGGMVDDDVPRGPVLLTGGVSSSGQWPNNRILSRAEPLRDFRAMLNDRSYDYTASAFEQMGAYLRELAPAAHEEEAERSLLPCIEELRVEGISRERPSDYNQLLRAIRGSCGAVHGNPLWARLCARAKELTLISSAESEESDVAPDEASAFLAPPRAATPIAAAPMVMPAEIANNEDELE